MSLANKIRKLWWGKFDLEYAGMKGWLPRRLQRTDEYIFGCRPYPGFYDASRWN